MARIEASGLNVRRGGREVLHGIGLHAAGGEVIGLIGPNGSGKTTALLALAGLIETSAGQVRLDGEPLHNLPPDARARWLGYLDQSPVVHWPMAVERVVALGRIPYRSAFAAENETDRRAVAEALERCGATALAGRPVTQLSGGERARAMLARVLAGQPSVLLADEPVAELDPFHQLHVMELLCAQAAAGMAVIVVLHDLSLAMRFCRRVYLLDKGRVAADGDPQEVIGSSVAENVFGVTLKKGDGWAVPWSRRPEERESGE